MTPFYRDSIENRQFGGQKSNSSRGNFRGEFRAHPLWCSVRFDPPYPGLRQTANSNCLAFLPEVFFAPPGNVRTLGSCVSTPKCWFARFRGPARSFRPGTSSPGVSGPKTFSSLTLQPLLFKKAREPPKKTKGFSLCRNAKILGKSNAKKKNRKTQKARRPKRFWRVLEPQP